MDDIADGMLNWYKSMIVECADYANKYYAEGRLNIAAYYENEKAVYIKHVAEIEVERKLNK